MYLFYFTVLPFLPLLKDRRAETGSNRGHAQQSLRKEKKGYFSNAVLMFYSPVESQQTPALKQMSSTKHFMEENQTVRGLTVKVKII